MTKSLYVNIPISLESLLEHTARCVVTMTYRCRANKEGTNWYGEAYL